MEIDSGVHGIVAKKGLLEPILPKREEIICRLIRQERRSLKKKVASLEEASEEKNGWISEWGGNNLYVNAGKLGPSEG